MRSALAVLTWNRIGALKETVKGLLEHCHQYPIAIFEDAGYADNTSALLTNQRLPHDEDTELEAIQWSSDSQKVEVYMGTANLGVAGNTNRALAWAWRNGYDHLCICNDDLLVKGDFVNFHAEAHAATEIGLFCFCDFKSDSYKWHTLPYRGYKIKLLSRMTGIMMSVTRPVVQTIGFFDPRVGKFGEEHSTPAGTPIWMGDYTFKGIEKVRMGDEIIGWKKRDRYATRYGKEKSERSPKFLCHTLCKSVVLGVKSYFSDVVRVTTESGRSFLCTPDHYWAEYNTKKQVFSNPKVGMPLVRVVDSTETMPITAAYRRGYVQGAIDGDGTIGHDCNLRVSSRLFANRFAEYASEFFPIRRSTYTSKAPEGERSWKVPQSRKDTEMFKVSLLGTPYTAYALQTWKPLTTDEWRGWLGGIYDAEGSWNGIGQSKEVNPDVYKKICEALKIFDFSFKPQKKQITIRGGRKEMLRFCNLVRPVLSYKLDSIMLTGRFKTKDRIVSVVPAGRQRVYCLKTTTVNYVAHGYASRNCEYTNRARIAGFLNIDSMPQHCLDVDHDLLGHQECESSVTPDRKPELDRSASANLQALSQKYISEGLFRPFATRAMNYVGGRDGVGMRIDQMRNHALVMDRTLVPEQ